VETRRLFYTALDKETTKGEETLPCRHHGPRKRFLPAAAGPFIRVPFPPIGQLFLGHHNGVSCYGFRDRSARHFLDHKTCSIENRLCSQCANFVGRSTVFVQLIAFDHCRQWHLLAHSIGVGAKRLLQTHFSINFFVYNCVVFGGMQIGENSRGDNSAFWVFCWRENFYCPIF
jgi:hypothetical protein